MERSEPSLVPEWLKSSGSATGSGTATHPLSSSSLNSEDHAVSKLARNKPSVNSSDQDLGRSSAAERISSSYFRRSSSSNGSAHLRSYSSFGRSQRGGRDWDKDIYESRDKDKSVLGDVKHRDYLDQLGNIYPSRFEKDGLRRSQSMISGKRSEALPRKTSIDSTAARNDSTEGNGLLNKVGSIGSIHKAAFERDFPSLGSEERQSAPDIGRVPSPGLCSTIHGLTATSAIGGDKWISALAEVPAMVGSSGTGISSAQQASVSSAISLASSTTTGLNMAEAVAQGPPRAHMAPQAQLSTGSQRLEELVIKQSRQLIPVTPSMPKPLVLSSSDKVKSKAGQQQHLTSSSLLSPSFRGAPVKTDVSKTGSSGKLLVLKSARERNGVTPAAKDSLSPTNNTKAANSPLAVAPPVGGSASRGPSNSPVSPSADRKHLSTMLEKRPTSQAQSRNDFFNLMRKKSMATSMSVPDPGPGQAVSPSIPCKASEQETVPAPPTPQGRDVPLTDSPHGSKSTESKGSLTCNGDAFDGDRYCKNGKTHLSSNPVFSEEEEAAFLRSLGWEENADEDGLTEEEIDAFVTKYLNSKLSLKLPQGVEPRFLLPLSSQVGTISSGLSSSDSKLES